jgi:hypothetical protein
MNKIGSYSLFFSSKGALNSVLLFLISIAMMSACFGTTVACIASTDTSQTNPDQIAGVPIAAGGSGDSFHDLGAGAVTGCSGTNIQFVNLTVAPTAMAGTYLSTLANQDLNAGAVTAIFSSVRGNDQDTNQTANDGRNNWFSSPNGANGLAGNSLQVNYEADALAGAVMRNFTLGLLGASIPAGGSITGSVLLCLGAVFGAGNTCAGTEITQNLTSGVLNYNVALGGSFTKIGVENTFTLAPGTTANTFLTSFDESFAESPEPSTFVLFGVALAGLSAIGLRKRKHS